MVNILSCPLSPVSAVAGEARALTCEETPRLRAPVLYRRAHFRQRNFRRGRAGGKHSQANTLVRNHGLQKGPRQHPDKEGGLLSVPLPMPQLSAHLTHAHPVVIHGKRFRLTPANSTPGAIRA